MTDFVPAWFLGGPHLQPIWEDEDWEHHWWPKRLGTTPVRDVPAGV